MFTEWISEEVPVWLVWLLDTKLVHAGVETILVVPLIMKDAYATIYITICLKNLINMWEVLQPIYNLWLYDKRKVLLWRESRNILWKQVFQLTYQLLENTRL